MSPKRSRAAPPPHGGGSGARRSRWIRVSLLVAALCATAQPARADDAAVAEALFLEAKDLMKQGKFAEACPKLEASYRLDKAVGTLMNAADCHEKVGKIASAWADWGAAQEWLKREGDKRAAFAAERQAALAPRLPKLRVEVAEARPGIDVYRGTEKLDTAAYNVSLPVDPGVQVLTVRRGDQILKEERVEAKERETSTVALDLAAIERSAPPPPEPPPPPRGRVDVGPPPPAQPPPPPPASAQKAVGFVVGGIGVAAVIAAGALEIAAIMNVSTAEEPDGCVNGYCSPTGLESVDRAQTFADIGQWVGIGGLVATGIGLTLVLTAPSAPPAPSARGAAPRAPRAFLAPWVSPSGAGATVAGTL